MALGYCVSCQKLVAIVPRASRFDGRLQDWFPIAHLVPERDEEGNEVAEPTLPRMWCGGSKRAIR